MRIGLLGGSFDPPHNGHLLAAGRRVRRARPRPVVFIPAAIQPLKAQAAATADQRLAMVGRLVEGDPAFEVSAVEIDRGGLSYTVDTLATLAARWPALELFWLVGADVLPVVREVARPGANRRACHRRSDGAERGGARPVGRCRGARTCIATRRVDISSTEVRQRVREGKSIRGFVPDAVADYIAAERLYR